MSTNAIEHRLPDGYFTETYYKYLQSKEGKGKGEPVYDLKGTPTEAVEKAKLVQVILDKYDSVMNDSSISPEDKDFFNALFTGVMEKKKDRDDPMGVDANEGFDDLRRAIERGDVMAINTIMADIEDMGELLGAFAESFDLAQRVSNIKPQTEGAKVAKMLFTGDYDGYNREKLEREAENAEG